MTQKNWTPETESDWAIHEEFQKALSSSPLLNSWMQVIWNDDITAFEFGPERTKENLQTFVNHLKCIASQFEDEIRDEQYKVYKAS